MKKYFATFIVAFVFLAAFASGQAAPQQRAATSDQESAPRKADAQFLRDYARAKQINAEISDATNRAAAKLERSVKPKRVELEGLTDELQAAMRKACGDIAQGCHYDEALGAFIPNPKPAAAPQQNVQPPAAAPAPEAKPDEKK